jgi:insulysin
MLFLGTAKYPLEGEYNAYLASHSGHANAYTSSEFTVYMFDISYTALTGALDRFSQFFVTPLFTENATLREMMAVSSEHDK